MRLKLDMNFNDALWAISDGNPGAINVIMNSMRHGESIDPENCFKAWGFTFQLDTLGIYGSHVWMLYKDVCRENLAHTIGMVRSVQMSVISLEELNEAIEGKKKINVEETLAKLCEKLPQFNTAFQPV